MYPLSTSSGRPTRSVHATIAWVAEQDRLFVAVAKVEGDQVSLPMVLNVRKKR